jgi:hypothetical protein
MHRCFVKLAVALCYDIDQNTTSCIPLERFPVRYIYNEIRGQIICGLENFLAITRLYLQCNRNIAIYLCLLSLNLLSCINMLSKVNMVFNTLKPSRNCLFEQSVTLCLVSTYFI